MPGGRRYEPASPVTVAEARDTVERGADPEVIARALIGMSLFEQDRVPAEELLRFCSRWRSGDIQAAALHGIGHMARRFRMVDGATWALLHAATADESFAGESALEDALDDLHNFIEEPPAWSPPVLELRGDRFDDFASFVIEVNRSVLPGYEAGVGRPWSGNLDALNDTLRGGFGTPEDGFVLRWRLADRSREALGYAATADHLAGILGTCHPTNRRSVRQRIEAARRGEGPTLFDEIIEIIQIHGPGGREAADMVILELVDD